MLYSYITLTRKRFFKFFWFFLEKHSKFILFRRPSLFNSASNYSKYNAICTTNSSARYLLISQSSVVKWCTASFMLRLSSIVLQVHQCLCQPIHLQLVHRLVTDHLSQATRPLSLRTQGILLLVNNHFLAIHRVIRHIHRRRLPTVSRRVSWYLSLSRVIS